MKILVRAATALWRPAWPARNGDLKAVDSVIM